MNEFVSYSRNEARARGLKTYFTGAPCANGHIAYRYTTSGTCSACMKEAHRPVKSPASIEKVDALKNLTLSFTRVYDVDLKALKDVVWAYAVMRYPCLDADDVMAKLPPRNRAADTSVYSFFAHEDDMPAIRKWADKSLSAKFNRAAAHAVIEERRKAYEAPALPILSDNDKS